MIEAREGGCRYDFDAVWIKGMKMPDSCTHCPLIMNCDDCEGFEVHCVPLGKNIGYKDEVPKDRRREDCPLVKIRFRNFPRELQTGGGG